MHEAGRREGELPMVRFGVVVVGLVWSAFAFCQPGEHEIFSKNSRVSDLLKDTLRFNSQSYQEILPNSENPNLAVHRESGTVALENGETFEASWIYRGIRGKPNDELDLFAVNAGKAKTVAAANKACAKLVPLGEWRLVSVVHVMAFLLDTLPAHPMYDQPQFKGRFFWAKSLNEIQDKKNKEDFFAVNDGGGEKFQVLSFKKFILWIQQSKSHAKSEDERKYFSELLSQVEEGIPVLCIRGKEPQAP